MALFVYFQRTDFKSGGSTLYSCTCLDNQGCQQGSETVNRSIQHDRGEEPYAGLPMPLGVVNRVTLNLRKFSLQKSIFKQFVRLFTRERNPLYGSLLYAILTSPSINMFKVVYCCIIIFLLTYTTLYLYN